MAEATVTKSEAPHHLVSWRDFAYTGLLCFGIAIVIYVMLGGSFWLNAIVSFSIGWSINLAFLLLGDLSQRWLSPYVASIPLTAIGILSGMIIAGLIINLDPWLLYTDGYTTILLGAFFGIVGFAIFSTRGRLLAAEAELAQATVEHERQEKLLTQSELKVLQAQIEPHFLFNTLSNIAGLIHTNPQAAEQTLHNLTKLLRASLNRTREQSTTVAEELEIAEAYLEIQSIRMQGRLNYKITSEQQCGSVFLPPLLVQPLIENAIKHGIDPCELGGQVEVQVRAEQNQILIIVKDSGMGIKANAPTAGTGTGLRNVRERLQALYGDEARLTMAENSPQGVIATLTLPIESPTSPD